LRRRTLIAHLAGAGIWPLGARAQQKAMPVIGLLGLNSPDVPPVALNLDAFRTAMGEAGFVEGRNVAIEYRWAMSNAQQLDGLAAELVARKVAVIVTEGGDSSTVAAAKATSAIPVVFHTGLDPVGSHLVASLARPGGNLTGVSLLLDGLSPKLLQLVCELVPQARVIALLVDPTQRSAEMVRLTQEAALAQGVQLHVLKAAVGGGEIERAFATLHQLQPDALLVSYNSTQADLVTALAARHAIPAIYPQRAYPLVGGLMSYGPSLPGAYRLKADYTARILRGARPADLPVLQPTSFELVINVKTAKALSMTVPPSLLARADEVIE
jgi:putative ABC transport system substrate-binding protein